MTPKTSRRQFVQTVAAAGITATIGYSSATFATNRPQSQAPRMGLALGSGGANGLAHVMVIEALEDLGLRPHHIAGSSIGAVIGAMYAGGLSSTDIRGVIERYFIDERGQAEKGLLPDAAAKWADLVDIDLGGGGLLSGKFVVDKVYEEFEEQDFADLEIPLSIVAADLWSREQVILQSGALRPAIQASMAIPGVFQPVQHAGRILVDGGAVNPVPFDALPESCDYIVAVDVSGVRTRPQDGPPGYFQALFNSVKVMQQAIVEAKRKRREPEIFIAPEITDVRALEFFRAEEIYRQAEPAKAELKAALGDYLGSDKVNTSPGQTSR
ncbi:MAG: patatin-like phospholipase family protein [Xanthomonadales bacterium]|nr:patatin-like phospholipase family protein [Xanthomonadales bacterium]